MGTGLILWESCTLQFLLHNSSTWMEMRMKDVDELIKLQNLFLNTLLGMKNCPALYMLWELGMLTVLLRLLKEKLLLYHHISTLPEDALARQILETQEQLNFPSLRNEIIHFLSRYEVHDVKSYSKEKWKAFVRDKINHMNREYLETEMYKYKKID